MPRSPTIHTVFHRDRNSLNALRLVLAILVIVSHSWPLGGYGEDPGFGGQDLGDWAVAGFFATSGFLIMASRVNSRSLGDYFWRRFLRIYPAFLVVLLVVAFVFAPLASALLGAGPYTLVAGGEYVLRNLGLYITQFGIDGMLQASSFPNSWNGPLWTLFYEFACYALVGLLVTLVPRTRVRTVTVGLFLLVTVAAAIVGSMDVPAPVDRMTVLAGYFLAGSVVYLFREAIPATKPLLVLAAVLVVVVIATGSFRVLAGLPVAYLMIVLGAMLPLHRIGSRNDISYGMYIYAFPLQQMLALALPDQVPVAVFILLAIALTIPFAWASWLLVERRAMRLKSLTARAPVDREGHVVRT